MSAPDLYRIRSGTNGMTAVVRDYITLTKPRVMVLLLLTSVTGMVLAAGGFPDGTILAAVLAGGIGGDQKGVAAVRHPDPDRGGDEEQADGRACGSVAPFDHRVVFELRDDRAVT